MSADPKFPAAPNDLGYLFLQWGKPESALVVLGPAVENIRNEPALRKNLGEANRLLGRFEAADTAFAQALKLEPEYGAALVGRAKVAEAQGRPDIARQYWTQLLDDPDDALQAQARDALARLRTRSR